MKYRHLSILVIVLLFFSLSIVACGDDEGDTTTSDDTTATSDMTGDMTTEDDPDPEEAAWIGVWNVVTEDGRAPAANGYNSLVLTLDADTFTSAYDSNTASCTWSGTHETTTTTLKMTTDAATGPPCDQAVGETRTAQLTLSADGNTLTLDWTAEAMGTLQVYERTS